MLQAGARETAERFGVWGWDVGLRVWEGSREGQGWLLQKGLSGDWWFAFLQMPWGLLKGTNQHLQQ